MTDSFDGRRPGKLQGIPVDRRDGRSDECAGELLARERRGQMSEADCLALRAHLSGCSSCRVARQIFVDLDDASGVGLRDGVQIERMSNAARRWAHQRHRTPSQISSRLWRRRSRLKALGLAASLVLLGGTASAAVWLWRHPQIFEVLALVTSGSPPPARTHDQRLGTGVRGDGASSLGSEEPAGPGSDPSETSPATGTATVPAPTVSTITTTAAARVLAGSSAVRARGELASRPTHRRKLALAVGADGGGPGLLLRQASDARRAGDGDRAEGLYRRVQREFPGSSEAIVSSVAIGGLLLDRQAPRAALAQFDAYLGSPRATSLIPEALYGRARALDKLRNERAERQTWDRLLADFPDSAYAPLARRRLSELK